jgi:hypothetical protein
MTPQKFDGVVEAVRYTPEGTIDTVRGYERRGAAFSDSVLIPRDTLIERIKAGKQFACGERKIFMAGSFLIKSTIHLVKSANNVYLVTNIGPADHDDLKGVPLF